MYAIITFRNTGPIKTWSAMHATNVHNARTKPLDHTVPGAPRPRHLIGSDNLVKDVKAQLRRLNIDPDHMRKNGVIAYEAILTASSDFFDRGTETEQRDRLDEWTQAQVAWAKDRYGIHRIASMVLHVDEKTPHVHLVLVPLDVKVDKRRADRAIRWSLVGRMISGPGQFDEAQDVYAAAMAPFGLVRGTRGSGRKHEPVPVYLARMAGKEREVDAARTAIVAETAALTVQRQRNVQDRQGIEIAMVRLEHGWHDLVVDRDRHNKEVAALAKAKAEHAALVAEAERRIAADRDDLRRHQSAAHQIRTQLLKDLAAQRADTIAAKDARVRVEALEVAATADRTAACRERSQAQKLAARVEAGKERLVPTFAAAQEFLRRIELVKGQALTPTASTAAIAARALTTIASDIGMSDGAPSLAMFAAHTRLQQQGAAMSRG